MATAVFSSFSSDVTFRPTLLFFFGCLAGGLTIKHLVTNVRFAGFDGARPVLAFYGRPDDRTVSRFLVQVNHARDQYLRDAVGADVSSSVAERITQLYWLNERGALSDSEFETLKHAEIKQATAAPSGPSGYA